MKFQFTFVSGVPCNLKKRVDKVEKRFNSHS